jgi:hypothetical protein
MADILEDSNEPVSLLKAVEYPDELCNNEVHKEALTMQFILQ